MPEVNAEFIVAAPPVPPVNAAPPAAPAPAPAAPAPAPAAPAPAPAAPAPAPADAPAAAPIAPVAFTVDPPAPAPAAPVQEEVVYEPTGDAGLDVALQYVGERGFRPEHPAMQAAMKGDFTAIEAELTKLGDKAKGAKAIIGLAKQSFDTRQANVKAATEKTTKAVHDAVGGPQNWTAIQAWAQENADPEEKAQLNAAFKAGGVAATAAATHLAALYQRHGKSTPKSVVKENASAVDTSNGAALSPREFAREVMKLHGKLGSKVDDSSEYRALVARRQAYRG